MKYEYGNLTDTLQYPDHLVREEARNYQHLIREKACRIALAEVEGMGSRRIHALLEEIGSGTAFFQCSEGEIDLISQNIALPKNAAKKLKELRQAIDPMERYRELLKAGIRFTYPGDGDYPVRLMNIPDHPETLFYFGELPRDDKPSVAIVGARACSLYGSWAAEQFGGILGGSGIQIISGLAAGIDGISQRAALEAGGRSFGVLGCGVDICYPASNRDVYEKLKTVGGVISEYRPGCVPRAGNFPPRNRIISGLADIVLVLEAREKSGTLITVDMALEQGREVFALPGRINDELSRGCHRLIRQGAGIASSPSEILAALYYEETALFRSEKRKESSADGAGEVPLLAAGNELAPHLAAMMDCLDIWPRSLDDIHSLYKKAAAPLCTEPVKIQNTIGALTTLCMHGLAVMELGGYYSKKRK